MRPSIFLMLPCGKPLIGLIFWLLQGVSRCQKRPVKRLRLKINSPRMRPLCKSARGSRAV